MILRLHGQVAILPAEIKKDPGFRKKNWEEFTMEAKQLSCNGDRHEFVSDAGLKFARVYEPYRDRLGKKWGEWRWVVGDDRESAVRKAWGNALKNLC